MTEVTAANFGALASVLARNLEDVADLTEYVAPPPGVYQLMIASADQKEINDKTALVVEYDILNCIQLNNAEDGDHQVKIPGSKMSEAFYFNDAERIETTLSVLKSKFGGLGAALGTNNLLEIMQKLPGLVIQAQITNRAEKKQPGDTTERKIYASTKNIVLSA